MKTFTFGIRFRFDSADFYETTFDLALSDEEIAFVKVWLNDNVEMPFWAFEYENEDLFGRMMKAHVVAILSYMNREVIAPGEVPFTDETVDWDCVLAEFCWPKKLQREGQK